ncbi:MAG: DNA translocase FtsK 4TM domain-containing protein, partial [Victivallales bacterium]|nr:DNA translocase FtsK 4TM domain-containing protein [Victivallales bacterium]
MLQDNNNPNIQEPEMASPDFKMYRIIFAVFLGICWLALLSFSPADIDQLAGGLEYTGATRNLLGALGARFAWSMLIGGGLASYILLFIATLCCIRRIFFRKVLRASKWEYFLGVPLFALGFCMMLGIFPEAFSGITKALNISTMPGGVLGSLLCAPGSGWLYMLLSATGSGIIAGVIILFSGMIIWSYDWRESTRAAVQYISRRIEENQVRKAQDAYQKECAAANVQEEAAPPVQPDIPPLTMHCDIQADAPSPESGIGFRSRRGEASIAAARAVNEAVGGGHAGNASAPAPRPQYQPSAPPPPPLQQRQPDLPLKQPTVQTPPPPPPLPAPSRPLFSGRSDNSSGYILPSSEFFTPPSETGSLSSSEEIQLNI